MNQPNTQGIDFTTIAEIVGAVAQPPAPTQPEMVRPEFDTGKALKVALSNPTILAILIGLVTQLWGKLRPSSGTSQPVTPPAPTPTPAPPPAPVPSPSFPGVARRVAGIRSKWYFFEAFFGPGKGRKIAPKSEYDAIVAGDGFVGAGYRCHVNITPVDQFGLAFENDDIGKYPELFALDPSKVFQDENGKWSCGEGNNRIMHTLVLDEKRFSSGDPDPTVNWDEQDVAALTSEYDDAACTPVLTISQDLPLSVERHLSYQPVYVAKDGSKVSGPTLPTIRVKPWGF